MTKELILSNFPNPGRIEYSDLLQHVVGLLEAGTSPYVVIDNLVSRVEEMQDELAEAIMLNPHSPTLRVSNDLGKDLITGWYKRRGYREKKRPLLI